MTVKELIDELRMIPDPEQRTVVISLDEIHSSPLDATNPYYIYRPENSVFGEIWHPKEKGYEEQKEDEPCVVLFPTEWAK